MTNRQIEAADLIIRNATLTGVSSTRILDELDTNETEDGDEARDAMKNAAVLLQHEGFIEIEIYQRRHMKYSLKPLGLDWQNSGKSYLHYLAEKKKVEERQRERDEIDMRYKLLQIEQSKPKTHEILSLTEDEIKVADWIISRYNMNPTGFGELALGDRRIATYLVDEGLITLKSGFINLTSKGEQFQKSGKSYGEYLEEKRKKTGRDDRYKDLQIQNLEANLKFMNRAQRDFWISKNRDHICLVCSGSGKNLCTACIGAGKTTDGKKCIQCHGKGFTNCIYCSGTLTIRESIKTDVEEDNQSKVLVHDVDNKIEIDSIEISKGKQYYNGLIAENRIKDVIVELINHFQLSKNNSAIRQLILLSSNWNEYEMNRRLNLITVEEKNISKNRITNALLEIIDNDI